MAASGANRFRAALAAAALCLLAGVACVHEVVEPVRETTYVTTRSGDQVTLSWVAKRGLYYNVFYADKRGPGASWTLHPDGINLRGVVDGQQMSLTDRVPLGTERVYRLMTDTKPFRPRQASPGR